MKIALIGFGSIGQRHYKNLKNAVEDVIVLSKRKDINVVRRVESWVDLRKYGPFDAVFVTNETHKHLPTIRKCIGLKPKAIFVEKPLAHASTGLKVLAKIIRREKISLFVGYNFQFYEPFLKVKKIIASGRLGKIYFMRVSAGRDLRQWRKRDYRSLYSANKNKGGGVMLDFVHDINYPAWMFGKPLIPQTAVVKKVSGLQINAEDIAESLFVTKDNIIISVHQDYLRIPGDRRLEVVAEKGTLIWSHSSGAISVYSEISTKKILVDGGYDKMYIIELRYFLNQVRKGKFFTNIEEAINDIKNIEFLKKSF